ncbi:MAG: hypothetical protein R3B45_13920 [Bdellovibrionota bacterium]
MKICLGILALAILSCKNDAPQVGTTKTTQEEELKLVIVHKTQPSIPLGL